MCYLVYLATTSDADLAAANTERITFERVLGEPADEAACLLSLPHRWYVSWMGGCSCGLRHMALVNRSVLWGFGPPVDWCPEDEEELADTGHLYRVIASLAHSGHTVECLDVWAGTPPDQIEVLDVDLDAVPESDFRLFENHLFRLAADRAGG